MSDEEEALFLCRNAILSKDICLLEKLLELYPELINLRDEDGKSIVHLAAKKYTFFPAALEMILRRSCDANVRDSSGSTPLHHVAVSGRIEGIKLLLSMGAEVNASTTRGVTPLHVATFSSAECVDLLIDHGADINAADEWGAPPIMWALRDGSESIAIRLSERGALRSVFAMSGLGETVNLSRMSESQPESVHARDGEGNTALHWAAWCGKLGAVSLLIDRGSEVECRNNLGMTPLHVGVHRYSDLDALRVLITHGASVDSRDNRGRTPLHYAAGKKNGRKFDFLVNEGADQHLVDFDGNSALMLMTKPRPISSRRSRDL